MSYLIVLIPLLLLAIGFVLGHRLFRGHLGAGIAGSALAGTMIGAFFGAAASAMATADAPYAALVKGSLAGLVLGTALGGLLAGLVHLFGSGRTGERKGEAA